MGCGDIQQQTMTTENAVFSWESFQDILRSVLIAWEMML